jgi:hypothetical protein
MEEEAIGNWLFKRWEWEGLKMGTEFALIGRQHIASGFGKEYISDSCIGKGMNKGTERRNVHE